jgi:hypothetical protein
MSLARHHCAKSATAPRIFSTLNFYSFASSSLPFLLQHPVEMIVVVTLARTPPDLTTVPLLPPTLTRVALPLPPPPTETGAVDMREEVAAMAAIALEDTEEREEEVMEVTEEVLETEVATATGGATGATGRREGEVVAMQVTEGVIGAMEETEVMILPGAVTVATVIAAVAMTVLRHPTIVTGLPLKRMLVATPLPVAAVVTATTRVGLNSAQPYVRASCLPHRWQWGSCPFTLPFLHLK